MVDSPSTAATLILKTSEGQPARRCGGCTLCCKLLPMSKAAEEKLMGGHADALAAALRGRVTTTAIDKPAGERCPHQRHGKGCAIYHARPNSCFYWNCRWLVGDDTADQSRPDRSHYVIDIMPDFVTMSDSTGARGNVEVVQVWIDPDYRDAHRDPALRAYLARRGEQGIVGLIRYGSRSPYDLVLIPPAMTSDRRWIEKRVDKVAPERTVVDRIAGIASATHKAKFD